MLKPNPLPRSSALVLKNGSKTCCSTSLDMPSPVSLTSSTTWGPALRPSTARSAAMITSATASRSIPPAGIASLALIARFRMALSSCVGSINATIGASPCVTSTWTASPRLRRKRSNMPSISLHTSVGRGCSACRLENASKRWVRVAPRRVASIAGSIRWRKAGVASD